MIFLCSATIFEDYEKCREQSLFGQRNGSAVCDTIGKLKPTDSSQLENLLHDLELNISCQCFSGCLRQNNDEKFKAYFFEKKIFQKNLFPLGFINCN
uniref:Uncharacterized protein n=1 Tax=Meloidogyne incognita TaxID=6306 RepID=A0A914N571_MELIC